MRIGIYSGRALPKIGGEEIVIDRLASLYSEFGHQVTLIAPRPAWLRFPDDSGYPYKVLRYPPHLSKRYSSDFYLKYLLKAHEEERFDIIHCHEFYPHAYLAMKAKENYPVPVVVSSHGGDVLQTHSRYSSPRVRQRALWAMKNIDAMVAISEGTHRSFREFAGDNTRIVDISNGVDLAALSTTANRPSQLDSRITPGQYILFLGRLSQRKGVHILLEAVKLIKRRQAITLVIAGYGREENRLKRLAQKLDIGDCVHFHGQARGNDKHYLLQNARCTVIPTISWEGCSLVSLESFAAGTPVVASNVPGIRHLVQNGRTGIRVEKENPRHLSEAIRTLWEDQERAELLGKSAREFVSEYDWKVIARQYLELFEELIDVRSPKLELLRAVN